MNKLAAQIVGDTLAGLAEQNVPAMTTAVERAASEYSVTGKVPTQGQVETMAIAMTTQDTALRSKRVWAFALPVISTLGYALLDPSLIGAFVGWLQAHPGAWWGVAANIVAVTLPIISKALDQRPTR
jgi:hypothetical protein